MREIIKNRKGQRIVALIEESKPQKGLAFVMHGLGGFKEQNHIQTITDAFKENGYTAVRFDATNSFGESDGNYEDATTTNYYEDLEDVIFWAKTQKWYQEPFVLAGHSLGAISTALFAEKYPEKVKAVAPISTVVSGKLSIEAHKLFEPEKMADWEKKGWREDESASIPGLIKRLKWSNAEDRLKYDLLPHADKLTMPVLLVVGENDVSTPLDSQKILYEKLPGLKELHVINGSPHTFRDAAHLAQLKKVFDQWIKKLDK